MTHSFVVVGPGKRKVGIVASNFEEFLRKCRTKFKFKKDEEIIVTLDDSTEIDEEYYEVLSKDTELHVSSSGDCIKQDFINQLAVFLYMCLERQPKIHDKVMECFQKPKSCNQATALLGLLAKAADAAPVSSRDIDTDWFKGLDTKFKTKEAVLRNSAESRMRGYLMRTKQELLDGDPPADSPYRRAFLFFKQQLCDCRHNAGYFDRTAQPGKRLCDMNGLFQCEGPYDEDKCSTFHFINPYTSREARIIFSTWNFDHMIEKSRTILPTLKTALSGPKASSVNLSYFHDLLFLHQNASDDNSSGNLKLVHIACHVKKPHELQCDSRKIFLSQETTFAKDVIDGQLRQQSPSTRITRFRGKRKQSELDHSRKIARPKKLHCSRVNGYR